MMLTEAISWKHSGYPDNLGPGALQAHLEKDADQNILFVTEKFCKLLKEIQEIISLFFSSCTKIHKFINEVPCDFHESENTCRLFFVFLYCTEQILA